MRGRLVGLGLFAHGLAHAWPGSAIVAAGTAWPVPATPGGDMTIRWIAALLWAVAITGFAAAGLGAAGMSALREVRRPLVLVAALASLALLLGFGPAPLGAPGILIDLLVLGFIASAGSTPTPVPATVTRQGPLRRVVRLALVLSVAWLGVIAATSPWHRFWGSPAHELAAPLPGDVPLAREPTYWIQHAVTIDAPVHEVWPWLAQLGTDRGGFYSHAWLENLLGLSVRNADRIHPEWQDVHTGGFVMATPPGWLGLDRPLGWTLGAVETGRVMVLETWGAFVLLSADTSTTRFIVRTRGDQRPTPLAFGLAWLTLAAFEPAHFIMERAMLLGVKRRAEVRQAT